MSAAHDIAHATLLGIAQQLREWARESRDGGWSTHQVDPMLRRADEISGIVASMEALSATTPASDEGKAGSVTEEMVAAAWAEYEKPRPGKSLNEVMRAVLQAALSVEG